MRQAGLNHFILFLIRQLDLILHVKSDSRGDNSPLYTSTSLLANKLKVRLSEVSYGIYTTNGRNVSDSLTKDATQRVMKSFFPTPYVRNVLWCNPLKSQQTIYPM